MKRSSQLLLILTWTMAVALLGLSGSAAQTPSAAPQKISVPKLWDAKQLATWAVPIAGVNAMPVFYSKEEYCAAPVDNLRTYPVYHPAREPKGYQEWLKQQGARPLIEPDKLKTEQDWMSAGRPVFHELDFP